MTSAFLHLAVSVTTGSFCKWKLGPPVVQLRYFHARVKVFTHGAYWNACQRTALSVAAAIYVMGPPIWIKPTTQTGHTNIQVNFDFIS